MTDRCALCSNADAEKGWYYSPVFRQFVTIRLCAQCSTRRNKIRGAETLNPGDALAIAKLFGHGTMLIDSDQVRQMTGVEINDILAQAGYCPSDVTNETWTEAYGLIVAESDDG